MTMRDIAIAIASLAIASYGRRTHHSLHSHGHLPKENEQLLKENDQGENKQPLQVLTSRLLGSSKRSLEQAKSRGTRAQPWDAFPKLFQAVSAGAFNPSQLVMRSSIPTSSASALHEQNRLGPLTPVVDRRNPRFVAPSMQVSQIEETQSTGPGFAEMFPDRAETDQVDKDASIITEPDPMDITLDLLEWKQFSEVVAQLAHTKPVQLRVAKDGLPVRMSREDSQLLQDEMEEAYLLEQRGTTIDFRGFVDVRPMAQFASKGRILEAEFLYTIAESLAVADKTKNKLMAAKKVKRDTDADYGPPLKILPGYFDGVPTQREMCEEIERCIDKKHRIVSSCDPRLSKVRTQLEEVKMEAKATLRGLIDRLGKFLERKHPVVKESVFTLCILTKYKHMLPGVVRDVSGSGASMYVEPKSMQNINARLRQLANKEADIEKSILKRLSELVGTPEAVYELGLLQDRVVKVDTAAARARYSAHVGARRVRFRDSTSGEALNLEQLRHPLLVWPNFMKKFNKSAMVPMDVTIPEKVRSVVITGPNTGGKTVVLKTLGMAALMAKAGLRVMAEPVDLISDEVVFPWYEEVMADIGDDQSIAQSLSTFSAHIARIRRILAHAKASENHDCLVLLDEVGSGTDPDEGSALGMAVLRQLGRDAALTVSTTHHSRLKTLKYMDKDGLFENACVEFDVESMAPTYRVLWGIPGMSNALNIAKRLGLQSSVVEDARILLEQEGGIGSVTLEEVIESLQEQGKLQRERNEKLKELNAETKLQKETLTEAIDQVASQEVVLLQNAQRELEKELETARENVAKLMKEAKQAGNPAVMNAVSQASQGLQEIKKATVENGRIGQGLAANKQLGDGQVAGTVEYNVLDVNSLEPGDRVLVPDIEPGYMMVTALQKKKARVMLGDGMEMWIKRTEITGIQKRKGKGKKRQRQFSRNRHFLSG